MTQRFGLLGCSKIAEKSFFPVMKSSELARPVFVGSRSSSKSKAWSEKYNCEHFGNYDDVINSDVDAIYISLPIGLHEEWSIKSLKAGKHVLCEKSATTSYHSALKMVRAAKENNKRILEGFSFRYHPQHQKVKELIEKELGEVRNFQGIYGFPPPSEDDIRWQKELGGGVLNDVTCYPIYASRLVFGKEPISVLSHLEFDENYKVDKSADMILRYENGKNAFISSGFNNYYQSKYSVWGSMAKISTKRAYAVPPHYETSVFLHQDDQIFETIINPVDQFKIMFDTFCNVIIKKIENPYDFERDLLDQAKLMEAIRVSNEEKRLISLSDIQ